MTEPLTRIAVAPHELLARAAAFIVERERPRLPDLTHCAVLVPDLHAAADVARALRAASGVPVLLLPRITTLELWAAGVPLEQPIATRAAREALLYQELQKRRWLASADLWAVSAELASLFEELTRSSIVLPAGFREFNRQLEPA